LSLLLLLLLLGSSAAGANVTTDQKCANLVAAKIPPPGDAVRLIIGTATFMPAKNGLPEYCFVKGHLDTAIRFAMKLPTDWNHKIMMSGNSGFAGNLEFLDLDSNLVQRYVTFGTDTGHEGGPDVLLNRPDRIKNFEYRGVHLVALAAKDITERYYGSKPKHAFFNGCSRGGTQGMVEATKFPTDFDGIIAGAPSFQNGGYRLWNSRAIFPNGPTSGALPGDKILLLAKAVIQKCDALDGIVDGLVDEPVKCNFSPTRDLQHCSADVDQPTCFTTAQITALEKIHQGPMSAGSHIGQHYYFSGVEGYSYGDAFGLGVDILDFSYNVSGFPGVPEIYPDLFDVGLPSFSYYLESMNLRYLVFSDPNYLLQNFNYDDSVSVNEYASALAPQYPGNPAMTAFAKSGGKLVMWQGLGDSLNNPASTRVFYQAGITTTGGIDQKRSFNRLFLVEGVAHCGGGPGLWNFDPQPALEQWVEHGKAPDFIPGSNPDIGMSRPICAFPQKARLIKGSLDPNVAANFKCMETSSPSFGKNWLRRHKLHNRHPSI